jgi:hypothetical protein
LLCVIVFSSVGFGQNSQPTKAGVNAKTKNQGDIPSTSDAVRWYRKVEAVLRKKTKVPLRLPTFNPYGNGLFAIAQSVDANSYKVQLAWTDDCLGGNVCHVGYVMGSTQPLPEAKRRRVPVVLDGGLKGYFIDFTCGAHCDDAAIYWTEAGYHYSIMSKAETKTVLIRMANSALGASRR